jgi:SAM-dependent methyltransferase
VATELEINVGLLKSEIRKTYASVSQEPEKDFIFPTGRAWAQDLGYPGELARVPDEVAESFAGVANPFSLGRLEPGERVLDLGSGAGTDSLVAALQVGPEGTVTGIDMTPAMLEKARAGAATLGLENPTFVEGEAERLPFPDASFDVVVMSFGLLHLAHPDQALAEAHRVLRPGGRIVFTVWARPEEAVAFGIVLRAIERHGRLDVPLPPGPPFFRFSDPAESRRALLGVGFEAPEVSIVPQVWRLPSLDALFEVMREGTVRTAGLLRAQTPETQDAIRAEIRERVRPYQRGDGVELPMPAVLASAVKR